MMTVRSSASTLACYPHGNEQSKERTHRVFSEVTQVRDCVVYERFNSVFYQDNLARALGDILTGLDFPSSSLQKLLIVML